VVVASDEETRVLLRGLLRLHHFRIVGEAEGATHAFELVEGQRPSVLVVDSNLAEGSTSGLISATHSAVPATRVVLVSPANRPPPMEGAARPDVVLPRPFRIHQFAEAIAAVGPAPPVP
jgi:DNA-binding NarL/FixJ family response regulator